jgi:GDSL-like Lipase/Acylhydrolase family
VTTSWKQTTRVAAVALAVTLSACAAEGIARVIDGYPIAHFAIPPRPTGPPLDPGWAAHADRPYLGRWPLADGVSNDWYDRDPAPDPTVALSPVLQARYERYRTDPIGALTEWNSVYLRRELCAGVTRGSLGVLSDFLTFRPPSGSAYPTFRHLTHANVPGAFTPNNFGWRGADIPVNKSADTIRLAFVGASTTSDDYSFPFAHTQYLENWLNIWAVNTHRNVRFEVINTGRSGIDSSSIAAIVRDELAPVEPDLIVYYEGANEFAPASILKFPDGGIRPTRPLSTFRQHTRLEQYSALAQRFFIVLDSWQWRSGAEPPKPRYEVEWPAAIDERNPDPFASSLPMHLERVMANLETVRSAARAAGSDVAIATFLWMVDPGMQLDVRKHLPLFRYLNETYYPADYTVMRRMADFQNQIFRRYAAARTLALIDFDREFPHDPDLFSDGVHLTEAGVRLEAWYYLQTLIPTIVNRVDAGVWPRPMHHRLHAHPNLSDAPSVLTRDSLLASCDQG